MLLIASLGFGQDFDIRFERSSVDCDTREACYNVQLRPNGASEFNLAGQNYRLFWDASKATFLSGTSALGGQYTPYTEVQLVQNADASATNGLLDFEGTLGFLNYFMDLNDVQNGGIVLPAGQWTTTSEVCYTVTQEVIDNPNECVSVVFAREALTSQYATAYVEVSRWVQANSTTNSVGQTYIDLDSNSGDDACFDTACGCAAQAPTLSGN